MSNRSILSLILSMFLLSACELKLSNGIEARALASQSEASNSVPEENDNSDLPVDVIVPPIDEEVPPPDNVDEELGEYTLLEFEDFEGGWGLVSNWATQHADVITGDAVSGSNYMRVARNPNVVDPMIGLSGSTIYAPNYISKIDPNEYRKMKWVLWFKYDDYRKDGDLNNTTYDGKLMYINGGDGTDTENSFFVAGGGNDGGYTTFTNNGGPASGWYDRDYGWKKSYGNRASLGVKTNVNYGTDGKWHKFTFEVDYYNNNKGYSRGKILIDDIVANSNEYISGIDSEGWFNLPPEIKFKGVRLGYTKVEHFTSCRDKITDPGLLKGHCSALSWDHIQVFGIK